MKKIYHHVEELIGHTPLFEIDKIESKFNLKAKVLVKLELFNPAGSVKDRVGLNMLLQAEKDGKLKPGGTIIEPTSGNTGIGLAAVAASRGYKAIFTMPETMSIERRKLLKGYGAEIVLTDGKLGMKGAIAKAEELANEIDGGIVLGQFVNPANPNAHFLTTGPEIWEDTEGEVDAFVAGVGTGGTITGTGGYLKSQNPNIKVIGVEPFTSAVLSGEQAGPHGLQGIGAGFIPDILDTGLIDEVCKVKNEEAYEASKMFAKEQGLLTGITSGAALHTAIQLAKRPEYEGKTIVALLPDTGERYLSTALFE